LDIVKDGPKPGLVRDLGGTYHTGELREIASVADVIVECTGFGPLVFDCMRHTPRGGIVCLTGLSNGKRIIEIDPAQFNTTTVLENDVIFGSVNANRRHYQQAAESLAKADAEWLRRLVTRRVPLERWHEALQLDSHNIKAVIEFAD
jgi:threonine dehydrogenase-like Zn-dependent dehydrogenase